MLHLFDATNLDGVVIVLDLCSKYGFNVRFTPVPDSLLKSAAMKGEKHAALDHRQQV